MIVYSTNILISTPKNLFAITLTLLGACSGVGEGEIKKIRKNNH